MKLALGILVVVLCVWVVVDAQMFLWHSPGRVTAEEEFRAKAWTDGAAAFLLIGLVFILLGLRDLRRPRHPTNATVMSTKGKESHRGRRAMFILLGAIALCALTFLSVGIAGTGDDWALDLRDQESWYRGILSALVGLAALAGVCCKVLSMRVLISVWGALCAALLVGAISARHSLSNSLLLLQRFAEPGPLYYQRAATSALVALAFIEAIGIEGLIIARDAGFSWGRVRRCLLAILFGAGVIAVPGAIVWFFAAIGVGLAQGHGIEWLCRIFLIVASLAALGALLALWLLERAEPTSRSPAWWASALLGFGAGVGACYFAAGAMAPASKLDLGDLTFVILGPVTIAATTVAGYSLSASRSANS